MPAYIGVNGKAKGIAKVYKGNSEGKANLIWSNKCVVKSTNSLDNLEDDRFRSMSGSIKINGSSVAIFAGGGAGSSVLDIYDKDLIHTYQSISSIADDGLYSLGNAANAGDNYLIFGGGSNNSDGCMVTYSSDGVVGGGPGRFRQSHRQEYAATSIGDYALFGGGIDMSALLTVEAFDSSLTRVACPSLTTYNNHGAEETAANNGSYALFAPGNYDIADSYDINLTKGKVCNTNGQGSTTMSISLDSYVVFSADGDWWYAYDRNLTQIELGESTWATLGEDSEYGPVGIDGFNSAYSHIPGYGALISGGGGGVDSAVNHTVFLNEDLTVEASPDMKYSRSSGCGAVAGNYFIFAGGEGCLDGSRSTDVPVTAEAFFIWE